MTMNSKEMSARPKDRARDTNLSRTRFEPTPAGASAMKRTSANYIDERWLAMNPFTAVRVICLHGICGLYCGDSGYFLVEPSAGSTFNILKLSVDGARQWAEAQGTRAAADFSWHWRVVEALLQKYGIEVHGIDAKAFA
jgi:hypothetical protein